MDPLFQISLPAADDPHLGALQTLCGDSWESVLDVVVLKPPAAGLPGQEMPGVRAYRRLGPIGPGVYTSWELLFDEQVTRWVGAIVWRRENPARLRRLSPALHDLALRLDDFEPDWADVPFMRTIRMLLLAEALFVPGLRFDGPGGADTAATHCRQSAAEPAAEAGWQAWRSRLHRTAGEMLRAGCELAEPPGPLSRIVRNLSQADVPLGEGGWRVWLPLLILTAVVYSQYEYYASVLWPAHSALRAHDELQRKWHTALKRIPALAYCCDLVRLLVRYQSAAGKLVRRSGDLRFLAVARRFAERTGGAIAESVVLDALGLMSILDEARLRQLPGTSAQTSIGPCRLNAGAIQPWNPHQPGPRDWHLLEQRDLTDGEKEALGVSGLGADRLIGRVFRNRATLRAAIAQRLAPSNKLSPAEQGHLADRLVEKARQTAESSIRRIAAACQDLAEASPQPGHAAWSWDYTSRLEVSDDDMGLFKQLVETYYPRLLPPGDAGRTADVSVFSFGLSQARDLKPLLESCVARVAQAIRGAAQGHPAEGPNRGRQNREGQKGEGQEGEGHNREGDHNEAHADEAGLRAFSQFFCLRSTEIPCGCGDWAEHGAVEHVVEVLLREELAALGLLLPGDELPPAAIARGAGALRKSARTSAADLLAWLFRRAASRLGLDRHALLGERYVPFPLVHRMLDVVARLRPSESLSVAVRFDGTRRRLLRLPAGLDPRRHGHLVRCLAGYVHAVVLNQAMSQGFRSCDVSFDGLHDPPEAGSRRGSRMDFAAWRQAITEGYRRNCYYVLSDKYLRDYNTERRSVRFLDASRPAMLAKPLPEAVPGELERWLSAGASGQAGLCVQDAQAAEAHLLLGLDVGATLTKIQFYAVGRGRLEPVGRAYQVSTPRVEEHAGLGPANPADRFAAALVARIEQLSRSDGELAARFEGRRASVLCVGVAWPGPVRDNHVAGTSSILANFPPLGVNVLKNRIEDILDLDVAGALARELNRSTYLTRGQQPLVALVNDGDAAGYGTLVIDGKLPGRRLAVVKVGTGTATAVFDDGQLLPGPCEGGKMLLDLGATPACDVAGAPEYPNGVANAYLSKRLMPQVARKIADAENLDFRVEKLGNREIGLFLAGDLGPLRDQCGLRDLAEERSVNVEILRRVLDKGDRAEIELQHQVERILDVGGAPAVARLRQLVQERGLIRLAELLHVSTQRLRRYFEVMGFQEPGGRPPRSAQARPIDPEIGEVHERIERFRRRIVRPCVEALGTYLGDFLVLLATQYGIDAFVVAGGVLRRRTGELARQAAIRRAALYGFTLRMSGSLLEVIARPPWMADAQPLDSSAAGEGGSDRAGSDQTRSSRPAPGPGRNADADLDSDPGYGTAGAAVFAGGELLLHLKQRGLEELRGKVLRLPVGRSAVLEGERVWFEAEGVGDVRLPQDALGQQEVREFLARERTVVGMQGPGGRTRYVRILAERSRAFETQP